MPRTLTTLLLGFLLTLGLHAQDNLNALYYQGNYQEVIRLCKTRIGSGDTLAETHILKALSEEQLGQVLAATGTLEQALASHPEDLRLTRMLARQYGKSGQYLKSRTAYRQLVVADSNDVSAWLELAEIASFRQQNQEAIDALEEVLRIDSIHLEGLAMMGEILDRHNNTGAVIYYKRAIRNYPHNQKVAYALSNWYIRAKQPHMTIPICETILSGDTTNVRFNKLLGYSYYKAGKPFQANVYLEDATRLGDSTAFVFKFMGISRYLKVDYTGAIDALRLSLARDSLDAEVHFFLGSSLATTKAKEAAMYHLEHSLKLMQPETSIEARIYSEQANIHRLEGRYQTSYEYYKRSYDTDSTRVMSLYLMASIQDNSIDNDKKALVDYERFIARLDRMPQSEESSESISIRGIVEDRIISLKEEIFFRDER